VPAKVILDCDPGHDDALAILLAHGSPAIELAAITTVAGNQTLDKTALNARRVCSLAGIRDVPIAAGSDRPLTRSLVTAPHIHGQSGLDGPVWGPPTVPLAPHHAVDLIASLVMASPGEITLVPTGPLTNVALALRREPRLATAVREVVLMGGSYTRGNQTPAAEFNVFVDPEAAAIVFEAGWPVTMVGLDLTHQALATGAVLDRIRAVATPVAQTAVELLEFFGRTYRVAEGMGDPPVHDACAVARLIRPEVVSCVDAHVAVETSGQWTRGMTVTDFRPDLARPANAQVATTLDVEGFWDLMLGAIEAIGVPTAHPASP
jgi:purine nucleosidase/pyrimidine-specific ribonucleoside hydrolase